MKVGHQAPKNDVTHPKVQMFFSTLIFITMKINNLKFKFEENKVMVSREIKNS